VQLEQVEHPVMGVEQGMQAPLWTHLVVSRQEVQVQGSEHVSQLLRLAEQS
jgi:hypothetical protein